MKEWLTQRKRGEKKRPKTLATEGSERPIFGHSPLGWLGENATAHYMLYLCSMDEQCTITLPCCSPSHAAVCLRGSRYCRHRGLAASSFGAHRTSHTLLPDANPGLCRETKAPYEFAYMKREEEQRGEAAAPLRASTTTTWCICVIQGQSLPLVSAASSEFS